MDGFEKRALLLVFLIGLMLRLVPVIIFGTPVSYDAPYHSRIAALIVSSHSLPVLDPSLGGRPYSYPPLYHMLLAELSILSGFSPHFLVLFVLPIVSSFVVLAFYLFFRLFIDKFSSLAGAFFVAIMPPLISASFDSPENIVFLAMPLILVLVFKRRFLLASVLLALNLFWNYMAFVLTLLPFFLAFFKEKKLLLYSTVFLAIAFLFWLFLNYDSYSFQSVQEASDFVSSNLESVMPSIVLQFGLIAVPVLLYSFRKLNNNLLLFWFVQALQSVIAMFSFFFSRFIKICEIDVI